MGRKGITIPVGDWAKEMVGELYPHLTAEQTEALNGGLPVPPSPDWRPPGPKAVNLHVATLNERQPPPKPSQPIAAPAPIAGPTGLPVVSCVLVYGDAARIRMAKRAVNDFFAQVYPRKELVIVNTTGIRLFEEHANFQIRELLVDEVGGIGHMRNLGVAAARGSWIKPCWDDDDIQSPWLLSYQMLHRVPGHAVLLTTQLHVDLVNNAAITYTLRDGIPNSMIVPAQPGLEFDAFLERGEDLRFWADHFGVNTVVVANTDPPLSCLTLAVYHGRNVTDVELFMAGHCGEAASGKLNCRPAEQRFIVSALKTVGYDIRPVEQPVTVGEGK
jgi:hypothetical protein